MHVKEWTQTFSTWTVLDLCFLYFFYEHNYKYWKSTKNALYMVADIVNSRPIHATTSIIFLIV